jgi:predicted acylesterase/phospholipase RssA
MDDFNFIENEDCNLTNDIVLDKKIPNITSLVISGGGPFLMYAFGVLKESHNYGYWNISNIKSLYGTSAGAMLAVTLSLNIELDIVENYIVKRPWQNVFKLNIHNILNSFHNCGILDISAMEELFNPLFKCKDLSPNISLKELYEYNKIDIHLYSVELESFELIDFSHTTHPDWRVIDVLYASSCLPILFMPFKKDGKMYCDGGLLCNYPLEQCIKNSSNTSEIFGISYDVYETQIVENYTLFDYFVKMIFKMNNYTRLYKNFKTNLSIENEISVKLNSLSFYELYLVISERDVRKKLIEQGISKWHEYIY